MHIYFKAYRYNLHLLILLIILLGISNPFEGYTKEKKRPKPNVLFIIVDDMADWAGYLKGHPNILTPNIDRLASRGAVFLNAHTTSPICGPSRAAVMTGMRPEKTKVYTNVGNYTDYVPDAVAISQHFMKQGYRAYGAGKVIHPAGNVVPEAFDDFGPGPGVVGGPFTGEELSTKNMNPTNVINRRKLQVTLPMNGISTIDRPYNQLSTFDWGPVELTDNEMPDGQVANYGVRILQEQHNQPFFLAVGFYRPHQPFFVPKKYFEMYDIDKIELPPTIAGDLHDLSETGKNFALLPWTSGTHKTVTEHNQWKQAIQGYLASITFADAQVGKLLDALENSPYSGNTIIVFWSDHGWHLGEKEHWGKHTPWQRSTKVPLIIVPAKNQNLQGFKPGQRVEAPVNLLDIYPTLIEMCELNDRQELDGNSLYPLLKNPNKSKQNITVSTIGRGTHSIKSTHWSYVHYFDGTEELYDLERDPNEWFNLANNPACKKIKDDLSQHIIHDPDFKQFIRMGRWKAVIRTNGEMMLFDILGVNGISEQKDISQEHPEIVRHINEYIKTNNITKRHVVIPEN